MDRDAALSKIRQELDPRIHSLEVEIGNMSEELAIKELEKRDLIQQKTDREDSVNRYFDAKELAENPPSDVIPNGS